MARLLFTLLLTLTLAPLRATTFAPGDTTDIAYRYAVPDSAAAARCKLDIHHPGSNEPLPVVVWFHGGGLTGGNKFIPSELKNSGLIVIAPNYRLMPDATIGECIDDAAAAVAWAFNHAARIGGDPRNIFVAGHSAGGYLTSMIGLNKDYLADYGIDADSIAALIPYSGQVIDHFAMRQVCGYNPLTPTVGHMAPLFHVRPDAPPYIIITGDPEMELYGRYEENLYMWRMLKLSGHPDVSIHRLDGYNHGDMAIPAHHILKATVKRLSRP